MGWAWHGVGWVPNAVGQADDFWHNWIDDYDGSKDVSGKCGGRPFGVPLPIDAFNTAIRA